MKEILLKLLTSNSARLTADEIEVRVRAFVIILVTLILAFIVFALLYSVTFVQQPIKAMAPIDQAYTKMLNDIVLLIVGGVGGIMTKGVANEASAMMQSVKAGKDAYVAPPVQTIQMAQWTPGPPHLDSEDERSRMAEARESVK